MPDSTVEASSGNPPAKDDPAPKGATYLIQPVDLCIDTLRGSAGGSDPSKAKGAQLYQEALDAERQNNLDVARKKNLQIIQNYPDSTLLAPAYFAFGEMFRNAAQADPAKIPLAQQSYLEVIKSPPGKGTMWGVAQYRLGQMYVLAGRAQEALSSFSKAAKANQKSAGDGCADVLAYGAVVASAGPFAEAALPDKCGEFYQEVTGDSGLTAIACATVAEKLAEKKKGADAQQALSASLASAGKATMDSIARASFCQQAQSAATAARSTSKPNAELDKSLSAACP